MLIKKRRTSETLIEDMVHPEWRRVFHHPVLRGFSLDPYNLAEQSVDASHLLSIAAGCRRGALLQTPLKERVFMYILCFFLWRVFGQSLLTDPEYTALSRHLWSGVQLDKINGGDTIPFKHRMAFIWDIPRYGAMYRKSYSLPLSSLPENQTPYRNYADLARSTAANPERTRVKLRRIRAKK